MRARFVMAVFMGLGITAIGAGNAGATFPGTNGKFAYICDTRICSMHPDGSGVATLTQPPEGYRDLDPDWSPDGSRIVFDRYASSTRSAIWVVNADGSDPLNITGEGVIDRQPVWSPDGEFVVFYRNQSNGDGYRTTDIYRMNPDGSDLVNLTSTPSEWEIDPEWSPDGTKIAFSRVTEAEIEAAKWDIFVMNADGSGRTQLTNDEAYDSTISWSPDGSYLLFTSWRGGDDADIFKMSVDGATVWNLTDNPGRDTGSDWSPDGTRIVYSGPGGITTMNPDGTDKVPTGVSGAFLDWQTCPSSGCSGGGETHARALTLTLAKHLVAKGTLSVPDGHEACRASQRVKVQRLASGRWKSVGTATTNASGAFSAKVADRPGKYRASAAKTVAEGSSDICAAAASAPRKHVHR